MNVTEAIADFLKEEHAQNENIPAQLYDLTSEVQVMVDTEGATPKGKAWVLVDESGNEGEKFWNLRIPKKAGSNPEFRDYDLSWKLIEHADKIGVTGWDWVNRRSRQVAFDFDKICGDKHKGTGIDADELELVRESACEIPWVEVRKSTSGGGLHLRVYVDVATANHTEHALLARYVLTRLSEAACFDFSEHVDVCGGNFWIWSRRTTTENEGFKLVKPAEGMLTDIPDDWRGLAELAEKSRRKAAGRRRAELSTLDDMAASTAELDNKHKAILNWLTENGWVCVPNDSNGQTSYRTHTAGLAAAHAHKALKLAGAFKTAATGQDRSDYNCFAFPQADGAFRVVRYGRGTPEADTWTQDGTNWTYCDFNVPLEFDDACRVAGGLETSGGEFQLSEQQAAQVAALLGTTVEIPARLKDRSLRLKRKGRSVWIRATADTDDRADDVPGWTRGRGYWELALPIELPAPRRRNLDHLARCVKHGDDVKGYAYRDREGQWVFGTQSHVTLALGGRGFRGESISHAIEDATLWPWAIDSQPFAPLYPGNRVWNLNGAQLAYQPAESEGDTSAWDKVLNHLGHNLTPAVQGDGFLAQHGVTTGADYLRAWIASLLQFPAEPLPYLFLFSEPYQNVGKSSLHNALRLLLTKGVARADNALTNPQRFNGELHGALVAVVEETDVAANSTAYERIKDWVTSREISIHAKGLTPIMAANTTHWIQCANSRSYCPAFVGDSRITMIEVDPLPTEGEGKEVGWPLLEQELKEQAPAFLRTVLQLTLPPVVGRLRLPVVETEAKREAVAEGKSNLSAADSRAKNALQTLADDLVTAEFFLSREELTDLIVEAGGGRLPSDPGQFGKRMRKLVAYMSGYTLVRTERQGRAKDVYYRLVPPDSDEWLTLAAESRKAWEEACRSHPLN